MDGIAADPVYLDVSVPPGRERHCRSRRRVMRSPTCSRDGKVLQRVRSAGGADRRRRDGWTRRRRPRLTTARWCCSIAVMKLWCKQARRHPVPAGLGEAARGAGRLVRADRNEHTGAAAASLRRTGKGHVPQESEIALSQLQRTQAERIGDYGDRTKAHGGTGDHWAEQPAKGRIQNTGRDRDSHDVVQKRKEQVLLDVAKQWPG